MAVKNSPEADDDIARIYAYGLSDFGRRSAEDYLFGLLETIDRIGDAPRLMPERSEINPPCRLYPYRAHHIFYVIENEDVLIVRVLHGSMNWVDHL